MAKKTAVKKQAVPKDGDIAYTITDKHYSDFDVLFSFNAWWVDRGKVEALIQAFKIDATIEEACVYAGITLDQYKYFLEKHPDFSTLRKACKNLPVLKARQVAISKLDESYSNAMDYLSRKRKDEFSQKTESHVVTTKAKSIQAAAIEQLTNEIDEEEEAEIKAAYDDLEEKIA